MLGPLLFPICINDLPNSSKLLTFFLFADDTNIYFETDDLTKLTKTVNKEPKKVKTWMDCNKLALNIDKTNFVLFHAPKKKLPSGPFVHSTPTSLHYFCCKKKSLDV